MQIEKFNVVHALMIIMSKLVVINLFVEAFVLEVMWTNSNVLLDVSQMLVVINVILFLEVFKHVKFVIVILNLITWVDATLNVN